MVVLPLSGSKAVRPDIHAPAALPAKSPHAGQAPKLEIGRTSSIPAKKAKPYYRR